MSCVLQTLAHGATGVTEELPPTSAVLFSGIFVVESACHVLRGAGGNLKRTPGPKPTIFFPTQ